MIQDQIRQIKEKIVSNKYSIHNSHLFITRTEKYGDVLNCYNNIGCVHIFTNQYLIENKIGEEPLSINCFRIAQGFIL